ncbi:MAG: MFS transporter [Pseudomonadales bacterium]|nr:MFS transporter [Pseudomonadales bacterium]
MQQLSKPTALLFLTAAAMPISFGICQALLNNFAIEQVHFTGIEMGILQSIREVPGFQAFTAIFLLLIFKEQTLLIVALLVTGIGTAITGFFPTAMGLYCSTVLMSIGFHYFETVHQSLSLQWFEKEQAAYNLGKLIAVGAFTGLIAYGMVFLALQILTLEMKRIYLFGGSITIIMAIGAWILFPHFPSRIEQHKKIVIRKRYSLYYALTFMGGARRQIFVVFAGFLMVEKFALSASDMALLFLINGVLSMIFAPKIGKLIQHLGERKALTIEYIGLIGIFLCYAFVDNVLIACLLYIADYLIFSMAIAQKTYFQKIAHPKDIAPTAAVAFSINHTAAVILPALYGLLWMTSPAAVFISGAVMATISLGLARLVPKTPQPGQEIIIR